MKAQLSGIGRRRLLMSGGAAVVATAGLVTIGTAGAAAKEPARSAVKGLGRLLRRSGAVGFAAGQTMQDAHDLLLTALFDSTFASSLDSIAVEWGNARYQELVDAYTTGGLVKHSDLRLSWRNTTVSPLNTWDQPVVYRLLTAVRAVNLMTERTTPLRVLLADPPVDWEKATSAADIVPMLETRDEHMATVVGREISAGRRCLFYAGGLHVQHRLGHDPRGRASAGMLLDERYPGSYRVVAVHGLMDPEKSAAMEEIVADWERPEIRSLRGTDYGLRPAADIYYYLPPERTQELQIQDLFDELMYLGPQSELAASIAEPGMFHDPAYWQELQRRNALFGNPHDLERLRVEGDPRFYSGGPVAD